MRSRPAPGPRSLRLRLLVGGALAILVSLIAAGAAMNWIFARHVERREIQDLQRAGLQLIAGLELDATGAPVVATPPSDPRFARPTGGLYWQVTSAAGPISSPSLWDQNLASPGGRIHTEDGWTWSPAPGPYEKRVLVVQRFVRLGAQSVQVRVAEDASGAARSRAEFGGELAAFLLGLWLFLCAAAAVQVELGLRPLRRLKGALDQMRRSPFARLETGEHPHEVQPLIEAINDLAQAREQDLARARRRAADLAHGLKTPLSVLAAHARQLRDANQVETARRLEGAIEAAAASVEAELARARAAAAREGSGEVQAYGLQAAERVTSVVERTEAGMERVFEISISPSLTVPCTREELVEMLGSLMENAARHAWRRVQVSGREDSSCVRLMVCDDGPGLEDEVAATALIRGQRLDETGPGHGLGLAIARDLAEARGGTLSLSRAEIGGLQVEIRWAR